MSFAHIDLSLAERADHVAAHHDAVEDAASHYATASEALFAVRLVALIVIALLARNRRVALGGVLAGVSAAVGLAAGSVLAGLMSRPRPFVAHHDVTAFIAHAPDPGFPSDHAIAAFAIATLLTLRFGIRGVPVVIAAIALAVSRVFVGVHYPGDVLAGALIGVLAALAVDRLARARWPAARLAAIGAG